jgi:arginase
MPRSPVLVVPQWQGSGHTRARELAEGAGRLAGLVGHATSPTGHWPAERTSRRFDVDSYDALVAVRAAVSRSLPDGPVLTIGGDCGADLEPIARELRRRDGDLAVVWLDAHADVNSPSTSPSGAFHGMVLRAVCGEGPPGLVADIAARPSGLVLAGTRAVDDGEASWLRATGVTPFATEVFDDPTPLAQRLRATGRSAVHIHVDLDVLDPAVFPWTGYPEPGGPDVAGVVRVIEAVAATLPVSSAFVGEHMGGDEMATATAAPIVAALRTAVAPTVPAQPWKTLT